MNPERSNELSDQMAHMLLPTPNTPSGGQGIRDDADWRGNTPYRPGTTSKIQVHLGAIDKLLMSTGGLIVPPSNAGRQPSVDQHQPQLNQDATDSASRLF
ncbi:hypothetical protein GCM10007298_38250 [Williamsia phyllosphaerae]|uniref:Uncharacterized protein n=1 Tax=Williamsia phyllosphaerae TaxID=885042 RepID=A0ABQ1V4Q2_9NOCA|nr:hypothetical protein GCM10007298_38250 [Williamsia phyllosphaerae]